jgi:ATP-binding cassette subfamily B protein/subfamily B ATP-binding cassette protein MsbA
VNPAEKPHGVDGVRALKPYVMPEWRALTVAAVCTTAVVAAVLARPLPIALIIDYLIGRREGPFELTSDDWRLLGLIAGLVLVIGLVNALGGHLADDRLTRAGERITHRLRMATYAQIQRLSLAFHDRRKAGDLVTRVTGDVSAVGSLFSGALGNLVSSGMLLLGMFIVSILIDPLVAVTAFAAAPVLAFVSFRFRGRVKAMARRQRAKESEIAALAHESIASVRAVKAFGAERFEEDRLRRRSEELWELELEASGLEGRFSGITDVLGSIALALVLVVAVLRAAEGAVTVGELVIMWTYARRIDRPLRSIARNVNRVSRGLARAERVAEILDADEVLHERPGAYSGPRARGELELDGASFSYEADRPALAELELQIPAGQRIALVGRSGAGKSTLAALIARFYDPPPGRGRVLIDGRDLRDCSLAWLRDQVGLVLQDTILFSGTVEENIAYGLEIDRKRVVRAAEAAGAHGFISDLPEGYETQLGAGGVGLSGGQRQRIAVARTLLRDPPVLVLDEPTTGLDAESEAQVLDGIAALMRGRTTIIVTHSLPLAATAERVVVVDAGRVVRDGTPDEVLPAERRLGATGTGARPAAAWLRRERPPVPADPALPSMADVLDPDVMAEVLARSLGAGARTPLVSVRYLRYRPQRSLVVDYDVEIGGSSHRATATIACRDLSRRARRADHVSLARLVDGRSPAASPLSYEPALGALIQWLPLDVTLPGAAEPPERLRRRLLAAGVPVEGGGDEPALISYRPGRRAVLRLDGHVLKCYAGARRFDVGRTGLERASRLRDLLAPSFEAALPDLRMTVQTHLAGAAVSAPAARASDAGGLLAVLHRAPPEGLDPRPPVDQLARAASVARLVGHVVPELQSRVELLVDELERETPESRTMVASHGDFHARQLVERDGELALTDFDGICMAPPALDLACYASHLVRGEPDDLERACAALDALAEGYGGAPAGVRWCLATAILARASRPFRRLEDRWPERVESIVGAAEALRTRP